jgi:futalosine hydrolase
MTVLGERVLFVYAAAVEAGPLASHADAVAIGVGKTSAAMRLTAALIERRPSAVIAFGIAGCYPASGLAVGQLCLPIEDRFADEGVATAEGFVSLADLQLGEVGPFAADAGLVERLSAALGSPRRISAATVSTCSGTDAHARMLEDWTRAHVETMEGAAIALVCRHHGVPWAAVRCISNRTGDRARGGWDVAGSTAILQTAMAPLLPA